MDTIHLVGLKGSVFVQIKRVSHEKLQLEILGLEYDLKEKAVIRNEELRKTLLELIKNYDLSPASIHVSDITIATYLLL
ncbi:hypothetical protein [Thermocrinis sp.]|jgi:hypothetical protein|uniref:hypothetical protein n=1 Tax=Thermocrinis sp. TaxID=2024383 RepID=UPI003C07C7CB